MEKEGKERSESSTSRQVDLHVQHLLGDKVRRTAGDSGRAAHVGGICDRQTHSSAEVIKCPHFVACDPPIVR